MLIADRFYFAAHSHEGPESPLELAFMDKFSGYCLKLKDKIPPTHKLYDLIADYLKLSNSRDYNIAPLTDHALDIYDNTLVIKRLADGIEFEVAAFELEETDEKFVAQFVGDLSLRIDKLTVGSRYVKIQ
jgi:hypothetical protein